MDVRKNESYQTFVRDFLKLDVLVACPSCSKKAIVKSACVTFNKSVQSAVKVICAHCGYNKQLIDKPEAILYSTSNRKLPGQYCMIGTAIDPFFHLPLWLQANVEENTLWAYNATHLAFLHDHIAAKLRERHGQERYNSSLGSRLPKWMTSKKNRELVLKKINELQNRLS